MAERGAGRVILSAGGARVGIRNQSWKSYIAAAAAAACVGLFFTLNRSFYPSTSSTTIVRADSSILIFVIERYNICGHKATPQEEILRCKKLGMQQ